jgi:hypothetical protein
MRNPFDQFLLAALFVFLSCASACKKTVDPPENDTVASPVHSIAADNLLANSNFDIWSPGEDGLQNWNIQASHKTTLLRTTTGIQFNGNTTGAYNISQLLKVTKKGFYEVSVTADYTLNDYSPAGIYVMDSSLHDVLGKFEKVYSSGKGESWQFVFYSKKPGTVAVVLGFLNGINGSVNFSDASLSEYKYSPKISGSPFSSHLSTRFPLLFAANQYDTTINRIADYVNAVLLCRYAYYADTAELPVLNTLIGSDTLYAYFNQYRQTPDQITDSYCQKSSLSLGEILTNEFNIPVRQIYMSFGGIGKHQFLEYWNPFEDRWIIIDPCFSTRYEKDNRLLGDEDFDRSTAQNYMVRYGNHYYYQTTDDLVAFWLGMDELIVKDYYTITFPFS